jgi:hypothetical protein
MDSLEIVTRINILEAHAIELSELARLVDNPVQRLILLVEVAESNRQIFFLESQLQR